MIRTLQKRFVVTAMTAVTVLLVVLLGVLNIVNALSAAREKERLLDSLLVQESLGMMDMRDFPEGTEPGLPQDFRTDPDRRGFFQQPMDEDARLGAVFFSVWLDAEGQVQSANMRRIASVSEEEARTMALEAAALGRSDGRLDQFLYKIHSIPEGGSVILFLDNSTQHYSTLRIAALSVLVGLLCWGAMLALVIALSRRAIRPIAENMERQRQFVTDAGHELKTPLAIILANLDAMELMGGESKYSRNIRSQARRLTGLTQNLLTLARIDESGTALGTEALPFSEMTGEALEMFREPAALKQLQVAAEIAPQVTVQGNRTQMNQLLSILLDNAVKYAPEGGALSVTLSREGQAVLRVSNSVGPERPPLDKIFDRFYRADSSRNQKEGGFGIGLSAAQAIVQLHKGSLDAAYEDDRIVFTVKLN